MPMFNSYVSLPEGTCKYNICLDENPVEPAMWGSPVHQGTGVLTHFFPCGYGSFNGSNKGNSWKIMENHPRLKTYFPVFADEDKLFRYVQNQPIPEIKTQTPILETLVECNLICIGSEVWDVYWYGSNFSSSLFVIRRNQMNCSFC